MIERLSTQEAARRLGISPATVRRKIAAGELQAEREARPQGARWWVLLDSAHAALPGSTPRVTSAHGTREALSVALETIADLRKRLDEAERGQAELRQLLAREQETARMLQAGTAQRSTHERAHGTAQNVSAASGAPQRPAVRRRVPRVPWWRRLLFGA